MLLGLRSHQQLVDCTIGEIRVTGTTKVCRKIQLPARFKVTAILEQEDQTVLFCLATPAEVGDLTWVSPLSIEIGDETRRLADTPSHYLDMNEALCGYAVGIQGNCAEQSGKCSERLKFTVAHS
jgi:hypothetical protein